MNYPYPELIPLLKFQCGPGEYWRILQSRKERLEAYLRLLPEYLYARCPICGSTREERIDTYSLSEWEHAFSSGATPYEHIGTASIHSSRFPYLHLSPPLPCSHFMGIKPFLKLHGGKPTEMRVTFTSGGISAKPSIPSVMPWWLESGMKHDIETYVVMHALPVCQTINHQFSPSYTFFTLTYFTKDYDKLAYEIQKPWSDEIARNDPEFYSTPFLEPENAKQFYRMDKKYDLAYWAQAGLLGWLDFNEPEALPLRIGTGLSLPNTYHSIQGKR